MKRQVYLFKKMRKLSMFITAVKSIYLFHQKKEKEKKEKTKI